MHNAYTFPSGIVGPEMVLTPAQIRRLDQFASESINGVDGGTWAPAGPVLVGGEGVTATGSTATFTGRVSTARLARGLVLPSDYPTFTSSRTRTVLVGLRPAGEFVDLAARATAFAFNPNPVGVVARSALSQLITLSIKSRFLHHGATLARARLRWRAGTRLTAVTEADLPRASILRVNGTSGVESATYSLPSWMPTYPWDVGDLVQPSTPNGYIYRCVTVGISGSSEPTWNTTLGTSQPDGPDVTWRVEYTSLYYDPPYPFFRPPLPATPDAYFAAGQPQEILIHVNDNNTVDTGTYGYALQISDPGAQNNIYHSVLLEFSNINDMREA